MIIGNESCDLDSAVCALSLAYFYQNNKSYTLREDLKHFLPVLNIPKRDFPLKTEVRHLFKEYNIGEEVLTFRDELNEDFMKRNTFVLVDHHVSPWLEKCVEIFDHRPKDKDVVIPNKCEVHIDLVGSCATLIAELYIKAKMLGDGEKVNLYLLRSTIVLDTVNFSESAARATPKDIEICSVLENALYQFGELKERDVLFESLVKARSDVSSLTASQLLRKDLKILISSKDVNIKIAIPGFPLPVQQFIMKPNAESAIKEFASEMKCSVVFLMGMYVHPADGSVHRDFGVINIDNSHLSELIEKSLIVTDELKLLAESYKECNFMEGSFYKQNNIRITRKHIIPIIKNIIDQ